jgi:phage anti-repressor protein
MTASWEKDGRKGVNRLFGVTRQTTKSYAEQILETIKKYGLMGSKYEYMGLEKGQGGLNIPRYKKHSTYLFDDINEMVMDYIKKNYPDWLQNIMDKSKVVLDIKFREKLNKYLKELDVVLDKDFKELDRGLKTKVPHVDRAISDLYKLHDGNIGKLKGVYKEFLDVKNKTEKYIKLERIDATTLKEFIRKLDNILKG